MGMDAILLGMGGHVFHSKICAHPNPWARALMGADGRGRWWAWMGVGVGAGAQD